MSFFKSLFAKKQPLPTRSLNHPSELQAGDIFSFGDSFALPKAMRKQQLEVSEINTIEFKHEHYIQVVGRGMHPQPVYISFPKNPQKLIKYSLLLTRKDVGELFDLEDFSNIFEAPGNACLKPVTFEHPYAELVAAQYIQQDFMTTGYFHQEDYRDSTPPQFNEERHGREFEFYSLAGDQEQRFIEIFIFENGDTDVYLSFLRPANEITELWIKGE
ncbi:conserved hypothetical protein [Psychromonas ingrahamii 37]|uniref:DUF4178 domain-containing protein n=1 Tax=Psychromonas ingrahamii (strain DSM 17664 / CCUG 51855 / 37) TaxID=357804 RepID=A1SRD7_PSYIN|nr:hypothetical protein [Psychromonas ingrahamii]ABM02052.1 conserved hypothetical protein [Psychromonas ingrahamii 37]